jgi:hypothetical protein
MAGGGKGRAPPTRAFDQRAAHWLGHAAVDVVDERLAALQAMPDGEAIG